MSNSIEDVMTVYAVELIEYTNGLDSRDDGFSLHTSDELRAKTIQHYEDISNDRVSWTVVRLFIIEDRDLYRHVKENGGTLYTDYVIW